MNIVKQGSPHVQWPALAKCILHGAVGKFSDALICIEHAQCDSAAILELKHFVSLFGSRRWSVD